MKITKSKKEFLKSKKHIAGGVNSPVRAFKNVNSTPLFVDRGEKQYLYDIDGNKYCDFILGWGSIILGHSIPELINDIKYIINKGTGFGLPTKVETEYACLIKKFFPSIEKIRFVNSGTEAVMSALRLARAFTKKEKIIKFDGAYHGHSDLLLVNAGSGLLTYAISYSKGVLKDFIKHTISVPFNNIEAVRSVYKKYKNNIAGIIIEPVCGNMGVIKGDMKFLKFLRKITKENNSLLIFDEIITGFRVNDKGAQGLYKITPDITCLGKIIGGGLPVGAFGGKKEIMNLLSPDGDVYQAGTLSGNPVVMHYGFKIIEFYKKHSVLKKINYLGKILDNYLNNQKRIHYERCGGMFTVFFLDKKPKNLDDVKKSNTKIYEKYFKFMLKKGFLLPPSQFEAAFLSYSHTKKDIEDFAISTINFIEKEL